MQWLKKQAHRNRWVAAFFDHIHSWRHDRLFTQHLAATIGEAVRWRTRDQVQDCLRSSLEILQRAVPAPPRKGSPSRHLISEPDLAILCPAAKGADPSLTAVHLQAASRIASLDPGSPDAFRLYLAVLWLGYEPLIEMLRQALRERIVLHISCLPRLSRAQSSIESFAQFSRTDTCHLKLVGNAVENAFDGADSLLRLTADDHYEGLPRKTFDGFALLTLACNPACILKLDDDHRLRDPAALADLMDFAAKASGPLQFGEVNRSLLPSAHHRAWHFGKCATPELNARILTVPAPRRWAAGSSGYILNRTALWRILWASLYYDRWIGEILYEDLAVAEVANKTGIRVVNAPMQTAIGAVLDY